MDFASVAWWAYALSGVVGIGFGVLQSLFVKWAAMGEHPHKWLYALKFALWAVSLAVFALISIPLLLVFTVVATVTLLAGSAMLYRKAMKEAR